MLTNTKNGTVLEQVFARFPEFAGVAALVQRTEYRRFSFSYGDIFQKSLSFSVFLAAKGIRKGDRVLLWAPNSPWWGVCYFGILLRGAVVVPVDFTSETERASYIAQAAGVGLVIQSVRKTKGLGAKNSIYIEDVEGIASRTAPEPFQATSQPDDIAEIVYTSGTTGEPKGVILTHSNIVANLKQLEEFLHSSGIRQKLAGASFLSVLPLSHMLEQTVGFLLPLSKGASVIYMDILKPSALQSALREERIHFMIVVPRLLQALRSRFLERLETYGVRGLFENLADLLPLRLKPLLFTPLRALFGRQFVLLVSGGAPLEEGLARFWTGAGFSLAEGYGLTECSPVLSVKLLRPGEASSVGKPLKGVHLKMAADGEILARGDNVSSGYFRRGTMHSNRDAEGWFPTGDLGTVDSAGDLHIYGRKKEIIVTGAGVNVSPERVERALLETGGVKDACAVGVDSGDGEEVQVVLIMKKGYVPQEAIDRANRALDPSERITRFSVWKHTSFPHTATLKVKRFEVKRALENETADGDDSSSEKNTDVLRHLVASVTHVPIERIHEHSLVAGELGLTSIGRLELAGRIEQEFRIDFEDTLITHHTKVADVRAMIAMQRTHSEKEHFRPWAYALPVRLVRMASDYLFHIPFFSFFITWRVRGLGHLEAAMRTSPVMFAPNHLSYSDLGSILYAMPAKYRYRVATAAYEEFFFGGKSFFERAFGRFAYEYSTLLQGVFMLPTERGFRKSLKHMGQLADTGKSILIFPEGGHPVNGVPLPVREGVGLIAKELKLPIIPVRIKGTDAILSHGNSFPRSGVVDIEFGEPIFPAQFSSKELVEKVRDYIRAA